MSTYQYGRTNHWTVAYRPAGEGAPLRVDLELTWHQAQRLAAVMLAALEGPHEVWYTTNAAYDAAHPESEDSWNIMLDDGSRILMQEGGELPEGIEESRWRP